MAFIVLMKAEDHSQQQIRSKLLTSGVDAKEVERLLGEAEVAYGSNRGDRGVMRVRSGAAAIVVGLVITVLPIAFSLFFISLMWFGPVVIAAGVFQLIKGILEIKQGNTETEGESQQ